MSPTNLTELEIAAKLSGHINFTDGHCRSELTPSQQEIEDQLGRISREARSLPETAIERGFKTAFYTATGQRAALAHEHVLYCDTASNSLLFSAKLLALRGDRVALIEPIFDNLHDILAAERVPVVPIDEATALSGDIDAFLEETGATALFLCTPSNPTGGRIGAARLSRLAAASRARGVKLVLDTSFRAFNREPYDQYEILLDSGVSFLLIEDTGKTYPAEELKASILAFSADLAEDVNKIYSVYMLRASPVHLHFARHLLEDTIRNGPERTIWHAIDRNRAALEGALRRSCIAFAESGQPTSVAWLRLGEASPDSQDMMRELMRRRLAILPGSPFFWRNPALGRRFIRIPLARRPRVFDEGLEILAGYLQEIGGYRV